MNENLKSFAQELKGTAEVAAMEFLTTLLVFEADGEVRDLAASGRAFLSSIVAATDARNPKIRFKLQSSVFESQRDENKHLENHIMYKGTPRKGDIRFPSRQVYGALSNMETVIGVLPVSRVRMMTRARANFSACGETNTHTRSYSGVPWRSFESLPRMALDVKDGVTGITSPVYEEPVMKETRTSGHPIFWRDA